jgi:hypothetical protein
MLGGLGTTADGKKGTQTAPITIKALNEGKVVIDGQGVRTPIWLYDNDWTIIEGVNARNGSTRLGEGEGAVVRIGASNVIVRRVVAWDSGDTNEGIVSVHFAQNVLLEDVAAFGIGRKVFESSQEGNGTTCRRCWGRWEGSHFIGPKHTYTLAYNNYDMTIENSIGTWSGEKMKQSYALVCDPRDPAPPPDCGKTFNNYEVDQPVGIFSLDNIDGSNKNANGKILGSIAYVTASDTFKREALIAVGVVAALEVSNVVAYIQPGSHSGTNTIQLIDGLGNSLIARNITSVGGMGMRISNHWQTSQLEQGATTSTVGNIFTGSGEATVCKRYKDRVLTNEPLWPWPMDQRIYDAMVQAGRTPFYVTQTIEAIFGPIPSECRSAASPAQVRQDPPRPLNVRATGQ